MSKNFELPIGARAIINTKLRQADLGGAAASSDGNVVVVAADLGFRLFRSMRDLRVAWTALLDRSVVPILTEGSDQSYDEVLKHPDFGPLWRAGKRSDRLERSRLVTYLMYLAVGASDDVVQAAYAVAQQYHKMTVDRSRFEQGLNLLLYQAMESVLNGEKAIQPQVLLESMELLLLLRTERGKPHSKHK